MQINVIYPNSLNTKDSLILKKQLGEGKYHVYQASSSLHKTSYALKLFPNTDSALQSFHKEQRFSHLKHPNIIKQIPTKCLDKNFHAHLLELAQYGDFHNITIRGLFQDKEAIVRTYFHQLVKGVEYLHSQGIAHLDLKLENMVIGEGFQLKIIDFDQAHFLNEVKITTSGTPCFRAPELIKGSCQDLISADIYSLGVILFALMTKEYPFMEVDSSEGQIMRLSSDMFKDNNEGFWKLKCKVIQRKSPFSEEFMELVNGLLQEDPLKRLRIQDLKSSKWYNGPVLSLKTLKKEMKICFAAMIEKDF